MMGQVEIPVERPMNDYDYCMFARLFYCSDSQVIDKIQGPDDRNFSACEAFVRRVVVLRFGRWIRDLAADDDLGLAPAGGSSVQVSPTFPTSSFPDFTSSHFTSLHLRPSFSLQSLRHCRTRNLNKNSSLSLFNQTGFQPRTPQWQTPTPRRLTAPQTWPASATTSVARARDGRSTSQTWNPNTGTASKLASRLLRLSRAQRDGWRRRTGNCGLC